MKLLIVPCILLLFVMLLRNAHPALAASITVNTTAQSPGQVGDCTLGEAIQAANTDQAVDGCVAGSGADIITLPAGTYTLSAADASYSFIGALGLPILLGNITLSGAGADTTIIQRSNDAPPFRILFLSGTNIVVQGVTVSGGTEQGTFVPSAGIGIDEGGDVTLDNLIVSNNAGSGVGAGGNLSLTNSQIKDNDGDGVVGSTAHAHPYKSIAVLHSSVTGNNGAGISVIQAALDIQDSILSNNANEGLEAASVALTLAHVTISNNGGSGLAASGGSSLSSEKANIQIQESSIFGNTARGMAIGGMNGGTVNFVNSTLAGNGGAFILRKSNVTLKLTSSTIAKNKAQESAVLASIASTGKLRLVNTILANNTTKQGAGCAGPVKSLGHNVFGKTDKCSIPLAQSDTVANPKLGAWMDNGAPGNGHYPLLSTSPAINGANGAKCPVTDQLDNARIGTCDTGAIEFIPPVH